MSTWHTVRRLLQATVVGASLLSAGIAQAAVPANWKDAGFSIDANGMTLSNVFEEFGRVYGVRLSNGLGRDAIVKGRLKADNGIDFLDRLAQPYKFRWFVYNDTLYIVPRDGNASIRLEVGEDAVQDAKQALIGIGLFDPRFGWGELPDEGIVIVSGPREYVNLARSILLPEEKKVALRGRQVMVFRLKYASATDRVISSRGRSETIPGVKSILSNLMLGHDSAEKVSEARARLDTDSKKRSRKPKAEKGEAREVGNGLFGGGSKRGQSDGHEEEDTERSKKSGFGGDSRPRIEADASLNAIMIYDSASKRPMYASLIEELDVEPQQVEIEALIVDIDRSKLSEMGVEWGVRSPGGNVNMRMNSTSSNSRGIDLPLPGSTLLISNAARFYARLKAMEGTGEARVLATPTVLTLDNVAAVLDLSQTRYMPLIAERYADLADVTAGTMLRVIPRIVREANATRVRLEVDIEDGTLGDNNANATVTRSTISTQAIVDVQQTLVIGGYHVESLSSNKEKVPVLGDVPVLGRLFRNDTQSYGSRERLFLITPRLVGSAGTPAYHQSKVVEHRASSIARASGALDSGRPLDTRDFRATPAPGTAATPVLPAPSAQQRTESPLSGAAVTAARSPAPQAAADSQAAGAGGTQFVRPLAVSGTRSIEPVATASASRRFDAATYAAATRIAVAPALRLQPGNVNAQSGRDAQAPAPAGKSIAGVAGDGAAQAPHVARMTAPSLPDLMDGLERRRVSAEPLRQPGVGAVSAARPANEPDPAYAALLIAEALRAQALQTLKLRQSLTLRQAGTLPHAGPSPRISGMNDLSLADRRRPKDGR